MELKKQSKYKIGDEVSFYYYYEDKIGFITEIESEGKYLINQTSNSINYTASIDKIHGKVIREKND